MDIVAVAVRQTKAQGQDGHTRNPILQIAFRFIREFLPADGVHGDFFCAMFQRDGAVIAVYLLVENAQTAHEFIVDDVMTRDIFRIESSDMMGEVDAIVAVDMMQGEDDFRVAVLPSGVEDRIAQMDLRHGGNPLRIFFIRLKCVLFEFVRFLILGHLAGKIPVNLQRVDAV